MYNVFECVCVVCGADNYLRKCFGFFSKVVLV